jgi:hypothetical protein
MSYNFKDKAICILPSGEETLAKYPTVYYTHVAAKEPKKSHLSQFHMDSS